MLHRVWILLAGALFASTAVAGAQKLEDEARAALEPALQHVVAILRDEAATPDEKRALIERELEARLDFAYMSRAALGSGAERFSAEELVDFSQEYERHINHFFLSRLALFRQDGYEITSATHDPRTGVVSIRALGDRRFGPRARVIARQPGGRATVVFGMRQRRGEWRIVSIEIEGVDVSRNFREQFQSLLRSRSPADLTEKIRQRNTANDESNPFD